ncbi:hypothetical protein AUC47_04785 [Microbacterium sp. SZ1]|uniref:flagellar hook-length control protein FliK n=1 Tax=Microbacterium sp. SZ1 TaxID=1849736 RepID=UPI000BBCDA73|nr:flagellar hook-length control protein FliK [Microbacterium sp. SZ1]PCE13967.1 hypothetical protein AUC47_04785 [Microbacterium sp. SZ1]
MSVVTLTDALLTASAPAESPARPAADAGSRFGEALVAAGETFTAESAPSDPVDGMQDAGPVLGALEQPTAGEPEGGIVSAALALLLALPTIDGGAPAADQAELGTDVASMEPSPVEVVAAEVAAAVASPASAADQISSAVLAGPAVRASVAPEMAASAASEGTDAAGRLSPDSSPRLSTEKTPVSGSAPVPLPAAPAPGIAADGAAPADGAAVVDGDAPPTAAAPVSASAALPDRMASGHRAPAALASASALPTITAVASPSMPTAPLGPTEAAAAASPTPRAVAAQVSPVVVSIAQRPSGTHQLTMTVNPDTLGPVTVRAHIGQAGDVRVELIGATDAGRDALRAIVTDLRRDLASAIPHASLSIAQGSASDPGADRGAPSFGSGEAGGEASSRRDTAPDASPQTQPRQAAPATPSSGSIDRDPAAAGLDILA